METAEGENKINIKPLKNLAKSPERKAISKKSLYLLEKWKNVKKTQIKSI